MRKVTAKHCRIRPGPMYVVQPSIPSSLTTTQLNIQNLGLARHRCRLCDVQPPHPLLRTMDCTSKLRRRQGLGIDAKTNLSAGGPRASMGGMLLHTVWVCQCAEACQTCKSWEYGVSTVKSGSQLVQKILPFVPTGNDSHHHQLVHHTVRGI